MVLDRIKKVAIAILILCILVLTYCLCGILILCRKKIMQCDALMQRDYLEAINILRSSDSKVYEPKTKEEYRSFIEKDLGVNFYIYSEKNLYDYAGKTYPLIRLIIIDESISGYKYCETFVHEAIHLKEFIGQEDYVCFETFKYLYESEELHSVGVWYGISQIYGFYNGEYDVSHLIVDYLTNK